MPALDDTVEEVLAGFDGTETYAEAEYALRDYGAKEISVNAANMAKALQEGVVPPGSVDADAVAVTPFATIAATDVQAALEEIVAEAGGAEEELTWVAVTWANGWDDFGSGYGDVEYAVYEAKGLVKFRGVANPNGNNTAFTLPAEARPAVKRLMFGGAGTGTGAADVNTDGTVVFFAGGTETSFIFDGVEFSL